MKIKSSLLVIISLSFFGCKKDKSLSACFNVQAEGIVGESVLFDNCSVDAKSYLWEFGDSTSSDEACPAHVFNHVGTFVVKLTAKGEKSTVTCEKTIHITNIINMQDKVMEITLFSQVDPTKSFTIDLDGDRKSDAILRYSHVYGSGGYSSSLSFSLNAGFEIATKQYSTVTKCWMQDTTYTTKYLSMPIMYKLGDTIKAEASFSKEWTNLFYAYGAGSQYQPCDRTYFDGLINKDYYFLGIKKTKDSKTFLGWIKLKCFNSNTIVINSYLVMPEANALKISE